MTAPATLSPLMAAVLAAAKAGEINPGRAPRTYVMGSHNHRWIWQGRNVTEQVIGLKVRGLLKIDGSTVTAGEGH